MRSVKALLLALTICALAAGASFGVADSSKTAAGGGAQAAAACGRCGDGQCVRSCGETSTSCPADCGVVSGSAAPGRGR